MGRLNPPRHPSWRTLQRRLALVLGPCAVVLVVVPAGMTRPAAGPYYKAQAHFNVTIQGTYTAHGTEVDKNCFRAPPVEGGDPQQITVTSTGTESLEFSSTASVRLDAYRYLDNSVAAGTMGGRTPIAVTTTKTLDFTEPCRPDSDPPVCGTRHMRLGMSLISRAPPFRLFYNFSDGPGRIIFPDDPLVTCRVPALAWWGKLPAPAARLSAAKVFNPRVKRFTVGAFGSKSVHSQSDLQTLDGHYDVRYTVTFVRRAR
ncbi:MAG: hypothetical protein QOG29_170 [Gaiellaceae bacterium]|nr:hypothetical protein [Gaiellaceae bacterium]MDX6477583.1 hypothetical protein [Gaiellaceae bacterium]